MSDSIQRVVKLGGSLLNWAPTPTRLSAWLACQPPASTLWVVGGGAAVEQLREDHRAQRLSDEQAHWDAIGIMDQHALRLTEWFPDWSIMRELPTADTAQRIRSKHVEPANWVWQPSSCLRRQSDLPTSWEATSDSIAAWAAIQCGAEEVVLLKSTSASDSRLSEWSRVGLVDAFLPQLDLATTRLWTVNLRTGEQRMADPAARVNQAGTGNRAGADDGDSSPG